MKKKRTGPTRIYWTDLERDEAIEMALANRRRHIFGSYNIDNAINQHSGTLDIITHKEKSKGRYYYDPLTGEKIADSDCPSANTPPYFLRSVFHFVVPSRYWDAILGDTEEEFHAKASKIGIRAAKVWYRFSIASTIFQYILRSISAITAAALIGKVTSWILQKRSQ